MFRRNHLWSSLCLWSWHWEPLGRAWFCPLGTLPTGIHRDGFHLPEPSLLQAEQSQLPQPSPQQRRSSPQMRSPHSGSLWVPCSEGVLTPAAQTAKAMVPLTVYLGNRVSASPGWSSWRRHCKRSSPGRAEPSHMTVAVLWDQREKDPAAELLARHADDGLQPGRLASSQESALLQECRHDRTTAPGEALRGCHGRMVQKLAKGVWQSPLAAGARRMSVDTNASHLQGFVKSSELRCSTFAFLFSSDLKIAQIFTTTFSERPQIGILV